MHVSLTPSLENMVRMMVKSGDYNNASEVVREALRMMRNKITSPKLKARKLKVEQLRKALDEGINDIELGNYSNKTAEELISEFEQDLKKE